MTWTGTLQYLWIAIVLAVGIGWIRAGYRRRRPHWTAASWRRFVATCSVGLALMSVPIGAEVAIALGWISRSGLTTHERSVWILAAVALLFAGAGTLGWAIGWFAKGDPRQPFPGASGRPGSMNTDRGSA